jgi:MarR family transcriptional regulator, lower aerobic nicotinate degradation pathway regulator
MKSRNPKTQTRRQGSLHPAGTKQRSGLKDAEVVDFSVDNQVGFLLRVAHQRHNANLATNLNQLNLTPPQAVVLARLLERDRVSQNLLGRSVAMEPANIRDVVLRLKSRGFVRQEKDPDDGRLLLLSLTPRGKALAQQLIHLSVGSVAATLRPLTLREGDTLRELLKKLVAD